MSKNKNSRLDSMYETLSIFAEGAYVFVCDMDTNVSRWSKNAVEYFGLPDEYMLHAGKIWADHIHPDDRAAYEKSINDVFSGDAENHNVHYRAAAADGSYASYTCKGNVIRKSNNEPDFFCGIIRNHSKYEYIDNNTGLRTVYGFFDDVKGSSFTHNVNLILMIGLSSFSNINDIYGYEFGNRVLQKFSRKIIEVFPDSNVYKMNGTRFAVMAHSITAAEAEEKYNYLHSYFRNDFFIDDKHIVLSLNGGAIQVDSFDVSWDTFYSCLRFAYYQSKRKKCGGFVIFDDIIKADNRRCVEHINIIRNSIAEGCKGFFLCYQLIVNTKTEKVNGVEALIRWKSDELGVVTPDKFIDVLEEDSLFPELGKWILRQAMEDGKKFLARNPDMTVSVNLSYTQIQQPGFVNDLFEIIESTGFPPSRLCLEITERCRLMDIELMRNMFGFFREKGIKIAVDDFGTGYASIGILRSIPVDVVKIDREFVKNIDTDPRDKSSVKFISDLATSFSADVCCEGIENNKIRGFVRKCDNIASMQGYFYSKPITADEILEKLDEYNND